MKFLFYQYFLKNDAAIKNAYAAHHQLNIPWEYEERLYGMSRTSTIKINTIRASLITRSINYQNKPVASIHPTIVALFQNYIVFNLMAEILLVVIKQPSNS